MYHRIYSLQTIIIYQFLSRIYILTLDISFLITYNSDYKIVNIQKEELYVICYFKFIWVKPRRSHFSNIKYALKQLMINNASYCCGRIHWFLCNTIPITMIFQWAKSFVYVWLLKETTLLSPLVNHEWTLFIVAPIRGADLSLKSLRNKHYG